MNDVRKDNETGNRLRSFVVLITCEFFLWLKCPRFHLIYTHFMRVYNHFYFCHYTSALNKKKIIDRNFIEIESNQVNSFLFHHPRFIIIDVLQKQNTSQIVN